MNNKKWGYYIPGSWFDLEDYFSYNPNKIVISSHTAAEFYGFGELIPSEYDLTVPKGYNNTKLRSIAKVKQRTKERYSFQLEQYVIDDKRVNIYSKERTIVEIIKENINSMTDVIFSIIRNFVRKIEYSKKKLLEAAREFKIERQVMNIFGAVSE